MLQELRQAIEKFHKCQAKFDERVSVFLPFDSKTTWDSWVYVFKIEGRADADLCYAWRSTDRRLQGFLNIPPIKSPIDAVWASLLADRNLFA